MSAILKYLHLINAALQAANAVAWFFYARVPFMGTVSVLATVLALYLAKNTDTYRYR